MRKYFYVIVTALALAGCKSEPTRVSIIGASIDTFEGYIPEEYRTYYPREGTVGTSVTSVEQTWWWKLIYEKMDNAVLDRNLSYSGSAIVNTTDWALERTNAKNRNPHWKGRHNGARFIEQDGLGNPDIVFLHGGGNDYFHGDSYLYVGKDGRAYEYYEKNEMPYDFLNEAFAEADSCRTYEEVCALPDTTFCQAYIKLTRLIMAKHPQAKVVHFFSETMPNNMSNAIHIIVDHYGQIYADLRGSYTHCLRQDPSERRPNGLHPSEEGMQLIADELYEYVKGL